MARYRRRPSNLEMLPGLFDEVEETTPIATAAEKPHEKKGYSGPRFIDRTSEAEEPPTVGMRDEMPPVDAGDEAVKLRFVSFGSGSSGNCAYLGTERGGILIDAGVDPSRVVNSLLRSGVDMSSVGGIILTHDHGDHVRFAYTLLRRFRHMRLYCTPKALYGLLRRHNISRRIKDYHQPVFKEFPFHLGPFVITPFDVSHDGTDNAGFHIKAGQHSFVVATDMGCVTERADYYIRLANHLMIESNYDLNMLVNGSYPEYLKARIIGRQGHMDNAATAGYLAEVRTPRLRNIFLCHLSHDNNTPELAIEAVSSALREKGYTIGDFSGSLDTRDAEIQLMALPRFDPTSPIILR